MLQSFSSKNSETTKSDNFEEKKWNKKFGFQHKAIKSHT